MLIRQIKYDVGRENVCFIHVTLVPYLGKSGELKTKPTQHSVKELRSIGIQPDIIVCRSEKEISADLRAKIGLFCNLETKCVIQNLDADHLYEVPLMLHREGLDRLVVEKLELGCRDIDNNEWVDMVNKIKGIKEEVNIALVGKYVELHDAYISVEKLELGCRDIDNNEWVDMVNKIKGIKEEVNIALVGKYVELHDAYISVVEALKHGGLYNDSNVNIRWINAEDVTSESVEKLFDDVNGILVPGGFGDRGVEGKIETIRYARENNIPFLGICLGMQTAVIEFARNVVGYEGANSAEIDPDTKYPVIDLMKDQEDIKELGGTMRLGSYPCKLDKESNSYNSYKNELIHERHRHRYEFNNDFRKYIVEAGMNIVGTSPNGKLVEIVEVKNHPWFVATQFHPELKSRPNNPHPLFIGFINASLKYRK